MIPIRTHETPATATAKSWDRMIDGGVQDLPIGIEYIETRGGVIEGYVSFWQPEPVELEALMAGGAVKLTIVGTLPPTKVEVVSFEQPAAGPGS